MVGISLLTLVPGVLGGSETYSRELVRGLARVGRHEYRVFVPAIAEDAADESSETSREPGEESGSETETGDPAEAASVPDPAPQSETSMESPTGETPDATSQTNR